MKRRKRTLNISTSLSRMLTRATILNTVHSSAREESRAQLEFSELHPMRYEPLSHWQFPTLLLCKAPKRSRTGKWTHTYPQRCYRHCSSTGTSQWEITDKGKGAELNWKQWKTCRTGQWGWAGSINRHTVWLARKILWNPQQVYNP